VPAPPAPQQQVAEVQVQVEIEVVEQAVPSLEKDQNPDNHPSSAAKAHTTPDKEDATAATASPLAAEVSPDRAGAIQTSLGAFRDTVIARQSGSDAKIGRIVDWVGAHLSGRGCEPCSLAELDTVLEGLASIDAVMVTEDGEDRVVWFV
jgi:hypothetical protein